jgi:hypothetical protein
MCKILLITAVMMSLPLLILFAGCSRVGPGSRFLFREEVSLLTQVLCSLPAASSLWP